jgi:hypothetical protein
MHRSTIERKNLIARSKEAKLIQRGILESTGEILSINQILKLQLHKDTGAKVLLRFDEWAKAGFTVKRSAKSVRIWGKKLNAKSCEIGFKPKNFAFYPMCCLFSEDQVIPLSDEVSIEHMVRTHAIDMADMSVIQ